MKKQQIVCDRCKKVFDEVDTLREIKLTQAIIKAEFESEYRLFGVKETFRFVGFNGVDLCHKCSDELIEWFYGDEKQEGD